MDINTYREAQFLMSKINTAEGRLSNIDRVINDSLKLNIGDGMGYKFEIDMVLGNKIKQFIKEHYCNELEELNEKFKQL